MLKMWILILHQASEQLWTADEQARVLPEISTFEEADLENVRKPFCSSDSMLTRDPANQR
jgi:hypothetical protein